VAARAALALLLLAAAATVYGLDAAAATEPLPADDPPPDPGGSVGDWLSSIFGGGAGMTPNTDQAGANRAAFLQMLRVSEGTSGPLGYQTYYGGSTFTDMSRHPNVKHKAGGITSTAAGAYQFLFSTWEECRRALSLPDFSPDSQDQAAIFLIKRRGALGDVDAGNFAAAVAKCAKEWASLPGAGYGQHENTLASLEAVYLGQGGALA
jgi:lysozyme